MRASELSGQDDKPWEVVIGKIDNTLEELEKHLGCMFSESQTVLTPRTKIKYAFFKYIWDELNKGKDLASLEQLDAHYRKIAGALEKMRSDGLLFGNVAAIIRSERITNPLPGNEMIMLKRMIQLYHSLARNRFILTRLNELFGSTDKFRLQMLSLKQQSGDIESRLARLNIDLFQTNAVDRLLMLNNKIVTVLAEKGYGNLNPDVFFDPALLGNVPPEKDFEPNYAALQRKLLANTHDQRERIFAELYGKLDQMPDLLALVNNVTSRNLANWMVKSSEVTKSLDAIHDARESLACVCGGVLAESKRLADKMADDYDILKSIQDKIAKANHFKEFFEWMDAVRAAQIEPPTGKFPDFTVLLNAGRAATYICDQQKFPILSKLITDNVNDIIRSTNFVYHAYAGRKQSLDAILEAIKHKDKSYRQAYQLIFEWSMVNAQLRQTFEVANSVLAEMEARVSKLLESAPQYIFRASKRLVTPAQSLPRGLPKAAAESTIDPEIIKTLFEEACHSKLVINSEAFIREEPELVEWPLATINAELECLKDGNQVGRLLTDPEYTGPEFDAPAGMKVPELITTIPSNVGALQDLTYQIVPQAQNAWSFIKTGLFGTGKTDKPPQAAEPAPAVAPPSVPAAQKNP